MVVAGGSAASAANRDGCSSGIVDKGIAKHNVTVILHPQRLGRCPGGHEMTVLVQSISPSCCGRCSNQATRAEMASWCHICKW
eukprot:7012798-Prorocentrum_lima.AAC.1